MYFECDVSVFFQHIILEVEQILDAHFPFGKLFVLPSASIRYSWAWEADWIVSICHTPHTDTRNPLVIKKL